MCSANTLRQLYFWLYVCSVVHRDEPFFNLLVATWVYSAFLLDETLSHVELHAEGCLARGLTGCRVCMFVGMLRA